MTAFYLGIEKSWEDLECELRARQDAAALLGIPDGSPYRARESELLASINEYRVSARKQMLSPVTENHQRPNWHHFAKPWEQ